MNINEYLKSLGESADEVAESLRKQGVKGKLRSRCHCPILNGIYQACPSYWPGLQIVDSRAREDGQWSAYATLNDSQIMNPTLPQPVMNFVGLFDMGHYADLVAQEVKEVRVWT